MAPLFAAAFDVVKAVVAILFFLVWIIGAIVKSANEQKEKTTPPLPRPKPNVPTARLATAAERAEFLRRQQAAAPRRPTPVKARPVAPAVVKPVRMSESPERRLSTALENRHGVDLHSRLESQHLHTQAVRGAELTRAAPAIDFAEPRGGLLGNLLTPRNLAAAMVLGQVLRPPQSLGGGGDPLGLPPPPR